MKRSTPGARGAA